MGQYDAVVERQRQLLAAEEWAVQVRAIHVHSLSSMWYDDRPHDTHNGTAVTDREFNSGLIERSKNGEIIHIFGKKLVGDQLIQAFEQHV